MQNQIELIIRSGGTITENRNVTIDGNAINGVSSFSITNITPSLSSGETPLIGGTIYCSTADVNNTATIVSYDNATQFVTIDTPILWSGTGDAFCPSTIDLLIDTTVEHFLDLYPNESISLSYQFTDLNNFTQIGTFSRDFRVPATKRNVEALGPLYDYNFVDDVQSFSRKYNCELRVDTIPISRGYLRVMAAYKQQDYLSDFQVSFYSAAPNFVKELGDKKLADITDLPTLNADLNFNEVTTITNKRIFALCDRAYNNKVLADFGETNTRPTQNSGDPLQPMELTPCVRADYLLTQIFADAGFELDATNLTNIIQEYYVPWCNSSDLKYTLDTSDFGTRLKTVSAGIGQGAVQFNLTDIGTNLYDVPNAWDNALDRYSPPDLGFYTFQVECTSWEGSFVIKEYDFVTSNLLNTYVLFTQPDIEGASENINFTSSPLYFTTNVYLEFWNEGITGYGYTFSNNLHVTIRLTDLAGNELDYVKNAPDIKQIDFVSDLIKMHNLAVIPDIAIENKLKLEPMQTYIGSGDTLDWTKKLDTSKDIVIKGTDDLRKTKLTFTYSAGQDTYSKLFVDQGRVYGDYKAEPYLVTNTQVPSAFQSGETSVKLVAQSTPATQVDNTTLIAPRFWTQNGTEAAKFTAPQLRFLYHSETSPIYLYDDVNTFSAIYQNVPIVTHYSDTSGFNPDYNGTDLNWAPETPLHDYTANPFDNLFTLYWRDYLDTIYSDDARILEANFALNNTDILTLNFADFIFVKDAYWRILELSDYKMGQFESTRVKLLKMNPGQAAPPKCNMKPGSVNPDGSVNFLNLSGLPVSATQVCCDAYNYTWSESTNTCYARPSDRPSVGKPNNDTSGKGEIKGINTISSGLYNINTTSNLNAGNSTFSVFAGNDITIEGTNDNLIAIGDTINLKGDQRGAALFGKSVESVVPGMVVGGGWPGDNRAYGYEGSQSAGTFLMSNQGTYAATLNVVELFIEGIANKRIEMEDNMLWYMRMHVMVQPTINQYINATITAQMGKAGGIAFSTAPIVQYQDTSMAGRTVALVIDTATNTAQHRLNIQLAGGTYPFVTRLLAEINYTQFR